MIGFLSILVFINPFTLGIPSIHPTTGGSTPTIVNEVEATTTEPIKPIVEEIVLPPELKPICGCESVGDPNLEPLQFNEDGTPKQRKNYDRYGVYWSSDWGACQINDYFWQDDALELGLDYKYNKNDNYKMALHVLKKQGLGAWDDSGNCWN